jgi:hypothetical protein
MEILKDELGEESDSQSLIILNYGDPAYLMRNHQVGGLRLPETIFLHIVSYLLFADSVSIPSRYILEGDAMAQAVAWAAPLLEAGIIQPERRVDADSFEDLARLRKLPAVSTQRAAFIDRHVTKVRSFRYHDLENAYRDLIDHDLSADGGFRRVVVGGRLGKYEEGISRAREQYLGSGDPSPESVISSVAEHAPDLRAKARRWAMARYYTTPLLFDSRNTREIPAPAIELLIRGRALDAAIRPFDGAAPARWALDRLSASIPVNDIRERSNAYCEALLEVRRSIPEARRLFSEISNKSLLKDAGDSLSASLAQELAKQQKAKPGSGLLFTLVSSLLSGAAGVGIGTSLPPDSILMQLGSGLALSVSGGAAALALQNSMRDRKIRGLRPWMLAIDKFETSLSP